MRNPFKRRPPVTAEPLIPLNREEWIELKLWAAKTRLEELAAETQEVELDHNDLVYLQSNPGVYGIGATIIPEENRASSNPEAAKVLAERKRPWN